MKLPNWLIKILVGTAVTLTLSMTAWAGKAIIADGNRITALEAHRADIVERLSRIERKLDRALGEDR